ncbi:MAG: 1-deoxy-D-xylulose-5-phosphate reductoisomerase [Bacteroidota bacterium]
MIPDLRSPFPRPTPSCREVVVLGSTGSIGTQTLEVAALHPEHLRIRALSAGSKWELLAEQARRIRPDRVAIANEACYPPLAEALAGTGIEVVAGNEALVSLAADPEADVVVGAVVGAAGLRPTLAALEAGTDVALATKEALVIAGVLVADACRRTGARVIPIDSEHSALFQCLVGEPPESVERVVLTASGGPFRDRDPRTFADVTPAEALKHPNWDMGARITVDSATMMNKGLEVIEARWLYDLAPDQIGVVVHPQSIVHSVVEFVDGSAKAQVGVPDMRVPIQYALSFPDRWPAPHPRLDWATLGSLDFRAPDTEAFPALGLAFDAMAAGGAAPAVLNAADEVAVAAFLDGRIGFTDIPRLVGRALDACADRSADTLDALLDADQAARSFVRESARLGARAA